MAVITLLFMLGMYRNRAANLAILAVATLVFTGALWLVRIQQTVGGVAYMKEMIPHHSIAIMASERARIRGPRACRLADAIIEAQVREIGEMKQLTAELGGQSSGLVDAGAQASVVTCWRHGQGRTPRGTQHRCDMSQDAARLDHPSRDSRLRCLGSLSLASCLLPHGAARKRTGSFRPSPCHIG